MDISSIFIIVTDCIISQFTTYTDASLWELITYDSVEAFDALYERYWQKLYSTAIKRLKNEQAAEEIVQDTFIILWQKRKLLKIDCVGKYLTGITKYAVFHYCAKQSKMSIRLKAVPFSPVDKDLEECIYRKQLLQFIEECSNELPEKCRMVFKLNKQMGYTVNQTATELQISPKTVEAHITRALKHLKLKLGSLL
ncbi:sigma-70 family RNA polymerase sigma factor [Danxiaibacter flavus]|uniref:Sigma-70 family RNA polymerase sigma factor n=1 Tax=Danxiaibacter flavus TaxID=3049108 RepID=A0ABV3ZEA1_9BACT|nr:sigma-70 family RNA polymerase sigma factor [Chitinophagaceae bacterium DXS]